MKMKQTLMFFLGLVFATTAFAADSYRMHEGDALQISVWGEETLNKEVRVLPDGSISYPLAGRMEVVNMTTPEVEKLVTEKLKTYLSDPQVTVVVNSTNGNIAFVVGKVLKPGPILLAVPTTVLQALSLAGGLDRFADDDSVKIIRKNGNSHTLLPVNYNKLLKGQDLESNVLLNPGDTVVVP